VYPVTLPVGRQRNASVSATKALRLELPAGGLLELAERDPEVIAVGPRPIDGCDLVFIQDRLRHRILLLVNLCRVLPTRHRLVPDCSVEFLAGWPPSSKALLRIA